MEHNASMTAKVMEVGEVLTIQFERDPVPIHLQPGSYRIERIADPEPEKKPEVKSLGEIAYKSFLGSIGGWDGCSQINKDKWQATAEAVLKHIGGQDLNIIVDRMQRAEQEANVEFHRACKLEDRIEELNKVIENCQKLTDEKNRQYEELVEQFKKTDQLAERYRKEALFSNEKLRKVRLKARELSITLGELFDEA